MTSPGEEEGGGSERLVTNGDKGGGSKNLIFAVTLFLNGPLYVHRYDLIDRWAENFHVPDDLYEHCYRMKLSHTLQDVGVDYLTVQQILHKVKSRRIAKTICEFVLEECEGYDRRNIFVLQ